MAEDDIYRTSTQYRLWSFTAESLVSLRSKTNTLAADHVRAAINRARSDPAKSKSNGGEDTDPAERKEVECLSVEEEYKLVGFYCSKAMQLADFFEFPTSVKASAVQYLKRFYLSNSPMTYHPKEIMPTALFLSTKTENHHISIRRFVSKLHKVTEENVLAPEFLLTQGLRFTFDVRHPQRGLEGGFMELMAMAAGKGQPSPSSEKTGKRLQEEMIKIEPAKDARAAAKTPATLQSRLHNAHDKSREVLKTSGLLTDVYFLYTPSQIWLSALLLVDEPLALFYLDAKLPASSDLKPKLISTLRACAEHLQSSVLVSPSEDTMKELKRIDKKLYKCRNPEKLDLIGISNSQKREGEAGEAGENGVDEKIIKKRKMEREKGAKEAEDVFGPSL